MPARSHFAPLYLAHYEYGRALKMIRPDIPLSSRITSKAGAGTGAARPDRGPGPAWPRGSRSGVPAAAWGENRAGGWRAPAAGVCGVLWVGAPGRRPGSAPPAAERGALPGVSAGVGRGRGAGHSCALQGHRGPGPACHPPHSRQLGTAPRRATQPGIRCSPLSRLLSSGGEQRCCGPGGFADAAVFPLRCARAPA